MALMKYPEGLVGARWLRVGRLPFARQLEHHERGNDEGKTR